MRVTVTCITCASYAYAKKCKKTHKKKDVKATMSIKALQNKCKENPCNAIANLTEDNGNEEIEKTSQT